MSDLNDLGFGQQDFEDKPEIEGAHQLDYTHEQIEALFDKICSGYVLSKDQFDKLINEIGLDNISTFDGKYASLKGAPEIPEKVSDLENDSHFQTEEGLNAKLVVLKDAIQAEVKDAYEIEYEAKQAKEKEKREKQISKKITEFDKEIKKLEYERKLRQMDIETLLKIEQMSASKKKKKFFKPTNTPTGIN